MSKQLFQGQSPSQQLVGQAKARHQLLHIPFQQTLWINKINVSKKHHSILNNLTKYTQLVLQQSILQPTPQYQHQPITAIINNYNMLKQIITRIAYLCTYAKTINSPPPRGKLMIIPTPIGNMHDLSPNIVRALFSADLIACQDRRVAGQLYQLIKNKNIISEMDQRFGSIGLTSIVEADPINPDNIQQSKAHQFYNYSQMNDKERRKFLRPQSEQDQTTFKVQYLKYRALKMLNKSNQFAFRDTDDKLDELYGIELSDLKYIETQVMNCRKKKGRGLLIPLNTYSETKMFDLVRAMLESKKIALVSDAGMPCISDPGWKLVDKIRTKMPDVPIEVIGGPSSVGIMTLQASLCSKKNSLSGRFQGFSSLTTGNYEQNNHELKNIKMQEFSINFINAQKLKKRLLLLEKAFSQKHNILLANELTKKYERRYNGNIAELISKMDNDAEFQPIGEVSYLVYPAEVEDNNTDKQDQNTNEEPSLDVSNFQTANVSIKQLLLSLDKHKVECSLKERCNLLCAVFGIKQGQARKYVYNKFATNNN